MQYVCHVRSLQGANFFTDHALRRAKMGLTIKQATQNLFRPGGSNTPYPKTLHTQDTLQELQAPIETHVNSTKYEEDPSQIYNASKGNLGLD